MRTRCRSRAYLHGRRGRYRTYKCRVCGGKFQTPDILINPLPEEKRVCSDCREKAARSLHTDVMVACRQGIYLRPDLDIYLNDIDYLRCLEYQEAQL
jgi:NAD-dependent SIR2 family protein deacetylase